MIVYHGSDQTIKNPDINHSKRRLDFGCGFYVTTVKTQAERWAKRKAVLNGESYGVVNAFEMKDAINFSLKDFGTDLDSWLDFVCSCRDGAEEYKKYDIIKGKVANDKVFRVVDMYKRGIWEKERAIREIRVYQTYDQIAFISQKAIDDILVFLESFRVKL